MTEAKTEFSHVHISDTHEATVNGAPHSGEEKLRQIKNIGLTALQLFRVAFPVFQLRRL